MIKSLNRISNVSKAVSASNAIRQLAHDVGPNCKLPSVNQLCDNMGISRVTLYQALNKLERQGVIVRKHGKGIYAAPGIDQKTVAILFGTDPFRSGQSPFVPMVLDQVRRRLEEQDGAVQFYIDVPYARHGESVRQQLLSDVESGRVCGVILMQGSGPEQARWLSEQNIPFVGSFDPTLSVSGIRLDHAEMVRAGVDALVRHGRRRLGLVAHTETRLVEVFGDLLRSAFEEANAKYALTVDPQCVLLPSRDAGEWMRPAALGYEELAYHGVRSLFERDRSQWPDGLIFVDDMMARGAIAALTRLNVQIPEDVLIASQTNHGSTSLLAYEPKLIRFEFDPIQIGDTLMNMLDTLVQSGSLESPCTNIPWTLRDIKEPSHD